MRRFCAPILGLFLGLSYLLGTSSLPAAEGERAFSRQALQNLISKKVRSLQAKDLDELRERLQRWIQQNFVPENGFRRPKIVSIRGLQVTKFKYPGIGEVTTGFGFGYDRETREWDSEPTFQLAISGLGFSADLRGTQIRPVCVYMTHDVVKSPNFSVRVECRSRLVCKVTVLIGASPPDAKVHPQIGCEIKLRFDD